jgi:hypothetical protein
MVRFCRLHPAEEGVRLKSYMTALGCAQYNCLFPCLAVIQIEPASFSRSSPCD